MIGFQGGVANSSLMTCKYNKGIVCLALYVDDCYFRGHEEAIDDTITKIKAAGFSVKVEDDLKDYLSCNIAFNKQQKKAWLGQSHLIKNLVKKFGELVTGMQRYRTPST
jgi:hypothetical protein